MIDFMIECIHLTATTALAVKLFIQLYNMHLLYASHRLEHIYTHSAPSRPSIFEPRYFYFVAVLIVVVAAVTFVSFIYCCFVAAVSVYL